jgi:hypothetical protein
VYSGKNIPSLNIESKDLYRFEGRNIKECRNNKKGANLKIIKLRLSALGAVLERFGR